MSATRTDSPMIAVVGMAARLPGAGNTAQFWRNVSAGTESVIRFTDAQLIAAGEDPALLRDPNYVRAGAPLDGVDLFDAGFFGFSARDAAILDPQHRQFLEVCWEALEDAGHVPESFPGAIGVFAGAGMHDYYVHHLAPNRKLMQEVGPFLVRHTGNDKDFLTTRASYCLNLTGPSIGVQTACSTSLVAIHMAAQSLLNGECDLALAGGVSITLPDRLGYLYREGEILSPDGHCRAFDRDARGTIFGSGVGVVVLRRAAEAAADRDHVYAVIRGSAVNNDGRGKVSYLAPSLDGQARCIAEALAVAAVPPSSIGYVEAHGTGTPMGDPIEVAALTQAFGADAARQRCAIGSVKTNVGHLDTAAGVVSFIKTALALQHRVIPPSLNFAAANPACHFEHSPFRVTTSAMPWVRGDTPRRASVNSIGVGGTNAHVVLEEAPGVADDGAAGDVPQLLCLSARSPDALNASARRLAAFLRASRETALADVAYTLQEGRRAFSHRRTVVAARFDDAIAQLEAPRDSPGSPVPDDAPPVVFMFPGGGTQYPNMGRQLYAREAVFRRHVDEVLALVETDHRLALGRWLFPSPADEDRAATELEGASLSLLATFAVEYALAQLWLARGVEPAALIGHSLGEVVAACVAGVMSLRDALTVVAARGRVLDRLPEGATLAVGLSESELVPWLGAGLSIAAVNGPALCVVSGSLEDVAALESALAARDVDARRLRLSFAAHSSLLDGHLDDFAREISAVRLRPPSRPLIANGNGEWAAPGEITRIDHWVKQLRHTVRFAAGLSRVIADHPGCVLLEVGPGTTLSSLAALRRDGVQPPRAVVGSLRHPHDPRPDADVLLDAVGRLWVAGVAIDWSRHRSAPGRRVPLPTYPFEHARHWIDRPAGERAEPDPEPHHDAGPRPPSIDTWLSIPAWRRAAAAPARERAATWLLFEADDPGHASIRQALIAHGDRVVPVGCGDAYAARADGGFVIRPGNRDDYDRLLVDLQTRGVLPSRAAHLWGLRSGADEQRQSLEARIDQSFFGLVFLAQAWGALHPADPLHLAVVSTGMQGVGGERVVHPQRAVALGPCLVVPREFANISCSSIDSAASPDWLDGVIAELRAASPAPIVARRGADRWLPDEDGVPWPAQARGGAAGLKPGAVYLITGGHGGVGLAVAEHLARTARARLVLVGRTPLPDRAEWGTQLRGDDRIAERIRRIAAIEALGVEVLLLHADVADPEGMREVEAAARARFGGIDCILHAAGVLDDGLIALKTRGSAEAVLRPKVQGTLVLQSLIERCHPELVVLFSSISSLVGLPGQVDYAAANAFLNAYAGSCPSGGATRVVAVDWAAWRDVGMAADVRARAQGIDVAHPLLGRRRDESPGRVVYAATYGPATMWLLDEHRVDGTTSVLPGTAYLEIVRAAVEQESPGRPLAIDELLLLVPLAVEDGAAHDVRITLVAAGSDAWTLTIASRPTSATAWTENARARARGLAPTPPGIIDLERIAATCSGRDVTVGPAWRSRQERRLTLGRRWRCLRRIRLGPTDALLDIELPPGCEEDATSLGLHPGLLDQAVGAALQLVDDQQGDDLFVPIACEGVRVWRAMPPKLRVHARRLAADADTVAFALAATDEGGVVALDIERLTLRRLDAGTALVSAGRPLAAAGVPDHAPPALEDLLADGIDTARGLEALDRILAGSGPAQVIVSPVAVRTIQDAAALSTGRRSISAPTSTRRVIAPRTAVERQIAAMWSKALGIEALSVEDNWFELGGHSLLGIRVLSQLRRAFNVDLPPQLFFDAPTVAIQATAIEGRAATGSAPETDGLKPVGRDQFRRKRVEVPR